MALRKLSSNKWPRVLRRPHFVILAVALSVVALSSLPAVATGANSAASSKLVADTEDPAVQAAAAAYYAQHYGVSIATAYQRLQIQDDAQKPLDQVVDALGSQWAGSWYDAADGGRFKIGVATTQQTPSGLTIDQARTILNTTGADGYTDFVSEQSSWDQLAAAQRTIDSQLASAEAAGTVKTSIDPATNAVVIDTAQAITTSQMSLVNATITASVKVIAKKIDVPGFSVKLDACESSNPGNAYQEPILSCDPPLRGGQIIGPGDGGIGGYCTAGFIVDSNSNGLPYLLTAGHCIAGAFGPGQVWSARQVDGWHRLGLAHSESWPQFASGVDAGLIDIDDPESDGWDTSNYGDSRVWVGDAFCGCTTQDSFYPIAAAGHSSLNMVVCTTSAFQLPSSSHHTDCGNVVGLGEDIQPGGGYPVEHDVAESNMCYVSGSSGGPVFKNNIGYGINSAASPGNPCDTYGVY